MDVVETLMLYFHNFCLDRMCQFYSTASTFPRRSAIFKGGTLTSSGQSLSVRSVIAGLII